MNRVGSHKTKFYHYAIIEMKMKSRLGNMTMLGNHDEQKPPKIPKPK